MSSPASDDYAGLAIPWKPMDEEFARKSLSGLYHRIEVDHGNKDGVVAKTDSLGATVRFDKDHEDIENSQTDSIDCNAAVDDEAQEDSEMEDSGITDINNTNVDNSIGDIAQTEGAEATDTDDDAPQHIDTKCAAVSTCLANSGDHRKVVSHIFGRNKACTRELPNNLWIFWCRKHYQRLKYRAEDAENWHTLQLGLVRTQLQTFEDWGEVRTWTIDLRKAEKDALAKENKNGVTYTNYISSVWERFLVPYLGRNKTFAQVRQVLELVERKFNEPEYQKRDKKLKTFPGLEFLPNLQKAKEVKKRALKKDEIGYKKITLDQPAFNRKTRANNQLIKEMAAKKREASSTPSKKDKSPDAGNASETSASKKRKTTPTDDTTAFKKRKTSLTEVEIKNTAHGKRKSVDATPGTSLSKALPIKPKIKITTSLSVTGPTSKPNKVLTKRRLTRGYEKHGSEGEDSTFIDEEEKSEEEKTYEEAVSEEGKTHEA